MSANDSSTAADSEMAECGGDETVTMMDVLKEQEAFEEDANAVLGASDDKNCTYTKGYVKRQALYACMTCCSDARMDPTKRAAVCLACSLNCHENHELIELYTKRNFRCDCGNPKFDSNPCQFTPNKTDLNENNVYNQNFIGLYCICSRPDPDPEAADQDDMIQCIICEDWLHASHLEATVPANDQYSEMICKACMENNEFLHDYTCYAVNFDVDVTTVEDDNIKKKELMTIVCNGDTNEVEKTSETNATMEVSNEPVNGDITEENCESTSQNEKEQSESTEQGICNSNSNINTNVTAEDSNVMDADSDITVESNRAVEVSNVDIKTNNDEEPTKCSEELLECKNKSDESNVNNDTDRLDNEPNDLDSQSKMDSGTDEIGKFVEAGEDLKNVEPTNDTDVNNVDSKSKMESDTEEIGKNIKTGEEPENVVPPNESETKDLDSESEMKTNTAEIENIGTGEEPENVANETEVKDLDSESKTDVGTDEIGNQIETGQGSENIEPTNKLEETGNVTDNKDNNEDDSNEGIDTIKTEKDTSEIISDKDVEVEGKIGHEIKTGSPIRVNGTETVNENKRKMSTDSLETEESVKKLKLEEQKCKRPKSGKKVLKGASFWSATFRQKLCTCSVCLDMYKDMSLLFLVDPEDTITAYEALGKEKIDGAPATQYEKGLEALSSLDRIQQINALTEYNNMRDKLLDFLKSFKDRKEVVKEEDIKQFFAGMKPRKEPDGVYFCR